jgi:type IV pilus secretin PilQ/predicted competence protein
MKRVIIITLFVITASLCGKAETSAQISDQWLTMSVESIPIARVLSMIATQYKLNLVLSDQVKGDISIKLDSVDLKTALNAILTANGYSFFMKDNVFVVKPTESVTKDELSSLSITLKYLDPIIAKKALESRKSEKGQVIILDNNVEGSTTTSSYKANRILITDLPSIVDEMVSVLTTMDIPERIIQIEARIIETTISSKAQLGFQWPTEITTKMSGADDGTQSSSTATSTSNQNMGAYDPENGRWTWGKLSVAQLSAVLSLLNQNGNSKLISDPRITTLENHEANIKSSTVIPIQTINRFTEGAATQDIVTFQDIDVAISLKVTPRINGDGRITLIVEPTVEDIIGYSGTTDNQKPITASRSLNTSITLKDGETAALGGLLKENEIKSTKKFPLLGDIPILGKILFSHSSKEKSTTELIILITPHILQ